MYKLQPVSLDAPAKIKVTAEGPLFAAVQVERMLHDSMMIQEIVLTAGSKRLDFRTKIDWKESHKLLKVCFPVAVKTEDALHEIQFGHLKRPTHATRPYDAARFEVCNQRWTALAEPSRGAAVLNDSKYGVNVEGSSINLTLLKAALAPDMTADKGEQEFVYSFYCWDGLFAESGLIRQGYELNTPVSVTEGFAEKQSLLSVDSEHIIIETVKAADDGSGDIIVRLYESLGSAESAALSCALPVTAVSETDMLENFKGKLNMTKSGVKLEFRPFEIKTLRLKA
jgi:alpha-mannosidase